MNLPELKNNLRSTLLESLQDEYEKIVYTSRTIETKAQANVAIAGIFIAGAFAYLKDNITIILLYQKILLGFGIIFLIGSVIFSIIALKVRKLPAPFMGRSLNETIMLLLQIHDAQELSQRMPCLIREQIDKWVEINNKNDAANHNKAIYLWVAQLLLTTAIIFIGVLTFLSIVIR
ncbi:MAG: hypothetical protein ACYC6G_05700 [Desulfobaccales bacterium]